MPLSHLFSVRNFIVRERRWYECEHGEEASQISLPVHAVFPPF